MIIAQISDTHLHLDNSATPAASLRIEALRRVVKDINTRPERPDAVIHTGDLAQNRDRAEYELLREMLSALEMPFYVTPGNRDDSALMADIFPQVELVGEDEQFIHYSIDQHMLRLVAIDTRGSQSWMGDFPGVRLTALRQTLDQDREKPTVIFMHHPPFEVIGARDPVQFESWDAISALSDLLSGYDNVVRIFCGHTHRDRLARIANIDVSSMPSVAPDLRMDIDVDPQQPGTDPVYQLHSWNGSGRFVSTTRAPD